MATQDRDECDCEHATEPCARCKKEIHQSWHVAGLWWIRVEECDSICPGWNDTVERMNRELTPREMAQAKVLKREMPHISDE